MKSIQPRKQRREKAQAKLHSKGAYMHVHLSKELQKKHGTRSLRVRTGDTVKVLRGDFKGKTGKVERVHVKDEKVYITGIEVAKKDGTKALRPIKPSNLLLQELESGDKRRLKKWSKTT
ncbi:50S ribosomal protein L24 [Candidatus Woesearchaeota archaeon]|nr:50S ribosomal protein L24 [Candidatus Woesearchaeota archaeon]